MSTSAILESHVGKNVRDLIVDYILPGNREDAIEIEVHRLIRFVEYFPHYYLEWETRKNNNGNLEVTLDSFNSEHLDSKRSLPLDEWYKDPLHVESDERVYERMVCEFEKWRNNIINMPGQCPRQQQWNPNLVPDWPNKWFSWDIDNYFGWWACCRQLPYTMYREFDLPKIEQYRISMAKSSTEGVYLGEA